MFNLPRRIYRLFSWIKTSRDHQNSLIIQEQLGNVVHQVVIENSSSDSNSLVAVTSNSESPRQHGSDESDLITSLNVSAENSAPINSNITENTVSSSFMPYQPQSGLSLLASSNVNVTSGSYNLVANQNSGIARQNRRHRRSRHSHRSSRSQTRHSGNSDATNSNSTSPSTLEYSLNLFDGKQAERNILSATCAVFCIAILAVSLVEIRWFYLDGGGCNVNYLGVAHFFAPGRLEFQFESSKISNREIEVYRFILPNGLVLKNCATREILLIMRTMIAFVFLGIFSSCIGMILDTFGCMRPGIKLIRRHGVFHILTVVFCLIVNGFCFWISEKMYEQQNETRAKKGKKIEISFDVSYYLIVLASGLSILATAFTLMRRYPTDEDEQLERLLEEYTGFEEPVHLERSLPAVVQPFQLNRNSSATNYPYNMQLLNNLVSNDNNANVVSELDGNYRLTRHARRLRTPPPPATPPPALRVNNINSARRSSNTEPPPPYDPTPVVV